MRRLVKCASVFVIVASHSWLKTEVGYDHGAENNDAYNQDDNSNKTTAQENTNLRRMKDK